MSTLFGIQRSAEALLAHWDSGMRALGRVFRHLFDVFRPARTLWKTVREASPAWQYWYLREVLLTNPQGWNEMPEHG